MERHARSRGEGELMRNCVGALEWFPTAMNQAQKGQLRYTRRFTQVL